MDQKDIEMEDAGKLIEDEVVGDQERVEKDQPAVTQVGDKREESSDAVNDDVSVRSSTEIGVEQEEEKQEDLSEKDAEGMNPNISEPVDEGRDSVKDATEMGDHDDNIDNSKQDATEMGDDGNNDATKLGDDGKIDDSKNSAAEMGDDDMDDEGGATNEIDDDGSVKNPENNDEVDNSGYEKHQEHATPRSLANYSPNKVEDHIAEPPKNELNDAHMDEGYESGTADDQERFMKEVDNFYKARGLEFKPPKFYGQMLNCLKLWRSVIKLGGYDRVTANKWWRQVGEAFHPPKTCTTVSWTFRIFYEKALLEYERHKIQIGDVELPLATVSPEAPTVENEANGYQLPGSGSGRARRDSAARAMQGWHSQHHSNYGGEEKNSNNSQKREKSLKSIGLLKHKRPSEVEHSLKAARIETSRQVVTTVADIGPPANWVKINVRETKDCFEVYALVPGLLREEVRVQSDPAGRVVITGQPEQLDNPWGITAFKKVVSLPARIDPLRTAATVSLHGRLLVRVPFEQSNI
ncbi:AT-rich interactive domain-containing protein 6-like isoform X2 [Rutidosis leptorrhynchoides]|uniref:AT-rich interactive domain-containing protein 6-like isoform X2 n=1 Tax=Rutidosis leptorrhynchoides TaxID=125765 RepID=UPI003A9A0BED